MFRTPWVGVVAVALLLAGACGSDDDSSDAQTEASNGDTESADSSVVITAVDYAFDDVPETVSAGTTLVIQNDSEAEVHELLAWRLPDDETRPMSELVTLPEEELAVLLAGPPVITPLAPPGADSSDLPAPAVLTEPGRYALVCFIPTGAPPDEVMAEVQAFLEAGGDAPGGPDYPETGPPHVVNGMYADIVVQ